MKEKSKKKSTKTKSTNDNLFEKKVQDYLKVKKTQNKVLKKIIESINTKDNKEKTKQ